MLTSKIANFPYKVLIAIVVVLSVAFLMPACSSKQSSESGSTARSGGNDSALHPLKAEMGTGCSPREGDDTKNWHWCGAQGEILITNPGASQRKIALEGGFVTDYSDTGTLTIEGGGVNSKLEVNNKGAVWKSEIAVKPGETQIHLRCDCKQVIAPNDPRAMFFKIENFQYREVDNR
jgi:hypothetical protein